MEAISDAPKYGSLKEALIGIYGEEVQVKDRRAADVDRPGYIRWV